MATDTFVLPPHFDLPPFFTMQPVLSTKKKQIEMWRDLILQYFRCNKLYELDINEPCDIFKNDKINRKLSVDSIKEIIQYLVDEGYAERKKQSQDCVRIYWRKPTEWASLIYKWVEASGLTGTVCTLYEIREGDDTTDQEFHGLDTGTLISALRVLEKGKKAQLFKGDDADSIGVKFF